MTNSQTTKTNHYFKTLMALAVLAMFAAMVLTASKPSYAASNTFTVTRIDDRPDAAPGDGICSISTSGTFCTLRAAIQEANATPDKDTIDFNINTSGGVATIAPNEALPTITAPVIIDGYTQQGAQENTLASGTNASLKIQLTATNAPGTDGLTLFNSSGSVIRGLVINKFDNGISVSGESNGNRIEGNFIGTDPSGFIVTTPTGTLDTGNLQSGVSISDPRNAANTIGGSLPKDANLISGNDGFGIIVEAASTTQVAHNLIGTDRSGTGNFGNHQEGVALGVSSGNSVRNNTIAFNGQAGVSVSEFNGRDGQTSDSNRILSNSIFSNGGLGINLQGSVAEAGSAADANDAGDVDTGPNGRQNKPVLTSAKTASGLTTIKGKLNSHPNETYQVQFFSNPAGTNEGRVFIGQRSVTTDKFGDITFTFKPQSKVAVGRTITATDTRALTHDTSEFSGARTVTSS
jgi:CSLREA domain-containing protein